MYIPQIKDKYSLVDLARYGTRARKHIHSDVLVGLHPAHPMFKEGDILDANATFNLIQCAYDQDRVYRMLSQKIEDFEADVTEKVDTINTEVGGFDERITNVEQKSQQALNNTVQLSSDLEQAIEKHDQDIQDVRQFVVQEIDRNTAKVVYDGLEENLLVYNVKHG